LPAGPEKPISTWSADRKRRKKAESRAFQATHESFSSPMSESDSAALPATVAGWSVGGRATPAHATLSTASKTHNRADLIVVELIECEIVICLPGNTQEYLLGSSAIALSGFGKKPVLVSSANA
jgi:hypothetical protein